MKKYLFIGNRGKVLNKMLDLDLQIEKILVVKNSFLENELLEESKIKFEVFESKFELLEKIRNSNFDYLISNGCPFILPVSELKKENQKFINIHPSLLPDLKGKHPVNGALLFDREHGVTCHLMDDGIDTGQNIEQIKIPIEKNITLGMLYQLSFIAEGEVFQKAFEKNFIPEENQKTLFKFLYYSRSENDLKIDFNDSLNLTMKRIKAFGIKELGAYFSYKGTKYKVYNAILLKNSFIDSILNKYREGEIIAKYDSTLMIKVKGEILVLENIEPFDENIFNIGRNVIENNDVVCKDE